MNREPGGPIRRPAPAPPLAPVAPMPGWRPRPPQGSDPREVAREEGFLDEWGQRWRRGYQER